MLTDFGVCKIDLFARIVSFLRAWGSPCILVSPGSASYNARFFHNRDYFGAIFKEEGCFYRYLLL